MKSSIETDSTGEHDKAARACACGSHAAPNGSPSYCATEPGQWVRVVRDFVKLLKFGEVHLTVHKGRVIEVRKIETVRFDEH